MERLTRFGKLALVMLGLGFWSGAAVAQAVITLDFPVGWNTVATGIDGNYVVGNYMNSRQ